MREGDTITTFYDPMISKLIVSAPDREQAIQALYNSLLEYKVKGLPTNIQFLKRVLLNKDFKDWNYDTSFIALNEEELLGEVNLPAAESELLMSHLAISNIFLTNHHKKDPISDPWTTRDSFRLNTSALQKVLVKNN